MSEVRCNASEGECEWVHESFYVSEGEMQGVFVGRG